MTFLEFLGFIKDGWEKRRDEKIMEPWLIGLSKKEREVVIGQVKKNKARLKAATDLVWRDLCESATRPHDAYHTSLLSRVIHEEKNTVTKPGTPRRRRVSSERVRVMEV